MGTDFNYLYSESMRNIISQNCLAGNESLLILDDHANQFENSEWDHFLPDSNRQGDANDASI